MAIVTLNALLRQLNMLDDATAEDQALITEKIGAAQDHIERLLGYGIEDRFGGADQDPVPPALIEAVSQLAAWWFEQREAAITGTIVATVPFSVQEIVAEYREWTF